MELKKKIYTNFSYEVSEKSDTEELPKNMFKVLESLYDNNYLNIKPLKVIAFYTNDKKGVNYNVDIFFDLPK